MLPLEMRKKKLMITRARSEDPRRNEKSERKFSPIK